MMVKISLLGFTISVVASLGGRIRPEPIPGWSQLTRIAPSVSETTVAPRNQPIVFAPTRPSEAVSPIWTIPETNVAKTNGAISILIRRRKIVVTSPNHLPINVSIAGSSTVACKIAPVMIPSASPIMM
jgi:hypothetical protein